MAVNIVHSSHYLFSKIDEVFVYLEDIDYQPPLKFNVD